jgi:hemolysin activation/secretion protein
MRNIYFLLLFPILAFGAPLQVPSSSGGIIDKQIEKEYGEEEITPDKEVPLVEIDLPEKELDFSSKKTVQINKILLQGNSLIPGKIFKKMIAEHEDRRLTIGEINRFCRKVQAIYAKKGFFLVRVYAPAQEIKDGILRIEVMEACLGDIEIVGNKFYKTRFIYNFFKKYLGKCLNYNSLLKTLLIVNGNTDLNVATVFQRGKEVGTVDMILNVTDSSPRHLNIDYNTYGSSVTSTSRSGIRTNLGNVITNGDTFSIIGVMGYPFQRLRFIDGIYNIPLSTWGASLETSFLYSAFDVNRQLSMDLRGKTQVAAVKYAQVLQRTARFSSDIYAGFEYKQIQNFANHETSAFDKLRVFSGGCKIDYMDALNGRNWANMGVFIGAPNFLGGMKAVDSGFGKCSRDGAGGRFVYIDGSYQRIQRLSHGFLVYLNFTGQLSFYKLPLSEEFYIGGINTVRGYPLSGALGDSGFYTNLEFRVSPSFMNSRKVPFSKKTWAEVLQFVGFIDHGEVYVYGGGVNDQKDQEWLTSSGLGLRIFGPYNIDLSADVGFPWTNGGGVTQRAIFYFKVNMRVI